MVKIKTLKDLRIMQEAGRRLKRVVGELLPLIKPGVSTKYIDAKAEELIIKNGGESSFKKVRNYKWSTCLPVNEQVVHTPPSNRKVKEGDVLTVDIGLFYKGFHTDFATSFIVGKKDRELEEFLKLGEETLKKAISKVRIGKHLGEVSLEIEREIYSKGCFIMKELTGHGIGRDLHEDPMIPGFLDRPIEKTYKIRPGLAIAIEVIYSQGTEDIRFEKGSDWSIVTADSSMSACFEHTLAVFDKKALVLT